MASKFLIDIDLNGNEIQNFGIQTTGTLPTSPFNGQTVNHSGVIKVYETSSTSWKYVGMAADGTTITETSGVISVGAVPQSSVTGLATSLGGKVDDSQVLTAVPTGAVFTDTQLTAEQVEDMVDGLISGSGATSVTYDDAAGTMVIASANDNTTYTAGNGIALAGTSFSVAGGDGLTQEASGIKVDATVVRTTGTQTIAGAKTFSDNVVINGDLTVSGAVTSKLSEEVLIEDNKIVVNSNETGTPSEDAGIVVERGTAANVEVMWDESADRWSFTNDGTTFNNIPVPSEYNASGDTNDFLSGATFDDATGIVTMTVANQSDVTVDLDGRYLRTESADYGTISVSGQSDVNASTAGDTVTYVAAGGMTITTGTDTVTFNSANDNTTYSIQDGELSQNNFTNADHTKLNGIETAATADQTAAQIRTALGTGNGNLVPAAGTAGHFLKHDGSFGIPAYTTNTNRSDASVYGLFSGGTNITISASGVIAGTGNTQLSDENVQDIVGGMVTGNTENGMSVVYQDSDGTLDFQNVNINITHDEASYAGGTVSIDAASNGIDITTDAVTVQVWDVSSANYQQVMTNVILDTNNDLIKVDLPAGDWKIAVQGIRL
tara:strand:+ start:1330 stop:3150 length:1821 start_codon:yes stop_codon:yes gene_type:complete